MANPNSILAKKIFDRLSESGLLSPNVDQVAFISLLETGKMQVKDWEESFVSTVKQNSNEITEATD